MEWKQNDIKLMVKRTFITSDLGEHSLPKWANWIKVVVDGMFLYYYADGALLTDP